MSRDDTYSTHGPTCPHCEHVITPDDPGFYDAFRYTEDECPACGGKFEVEVFTETSWTCTAIEKVEGGVA